MCRYLFFLLFVSLFVFSLSKVKDKSKTDVSVNEGKERSANTTRNVKKASDGRDRKSGNVKGGMEKKKLEKGKEKGEKNELKGKEKKEKKVERKKEDRMMVKIVDNPVTPHGTGFASWSQPKELKLQVKPSNFSGPLPFKALVGKCFDVVANNYKYQMCPFHNITQREQSSRWNSYAGVLGVWKDWVIENNTFVAWHMPNGDSCGDKMRQTKVVLVCNRRTEVLDVKEPKTCHYEMKFKTPLACSRRNMAGDGVYPWVGEELQRQWDDVEQEKFNGDVTQQGYVKYLTKIWTAAGFIGQQSAQNNNQPIKEKSDKKEGVKFTDVFACEKAYNELHEEVVKLRQQLAIFQPDNVTITLNISSQSNISLYNSTIDVAANAVNQTSNVLSVIHSNNTHHVWTMAPKVKQQTQLDRGNVTYGDVDVSPSNSVVKNDSTKSVSHLSERRSSQQEKVNETRNVDKQENAEGGGMSHHMRKDRNS